MSRRVALNAAWNLSGVVLPILAGVIAVPMLLHGLGSAKLGVFSLALGLFGFSGIFDLGLGRALTQTIASELGRGSSLSAIANLARRGMAVVLALGLLWAFLLWIAAAPIVEDLFHLKGDIATETIDGIHWLAFTLPIVLLNTSLIGILEGLQLFRQTNLLRAPLGIALFLVPALIAQFTNNLGFVIAGLALTRAFGAVLWTALVLQHFPLLTAHTGTRLSSSAMWRFTGWLSISNLVSPLMIYADRFYLASVFPPAVIALYTVPLDTIMRGTALPSTAMNAAFPALAHLDAKNSKHPHLAQKIVSGAGKLMMGLWFAPILIAGLWLTPLLTLWLGESFAGQIIEITQWLLAGVLLNGFAHIAYALLQSCGRSDLTAKLHVAELPVYALGLYFLIATFGITGAAMAWFGRVLIDTLFLFYLSIKQFEALRTTLLNISILALTSVLALALVFWANANLLFTHYFWFKVGLSTLLATATMWLLIRYLLIPGNMNRDECEAAA
jgi:O-antigen/teichoic acid export membrane protein